MGFLSLVSSAKIEQSEWSPGTTQRPFVVESASGLFVFTHEFLSGANSAKSPAIASLQNWGHPTNSKRVPLALCRTENTPPNGRPLTAPLQGFFVFY